MFDQTPIEGLLIFRPKRHSDARGFFSETWSRDAFAANGLNFAWCQDNHSLSRQAGVLRGLHFQAPPKAQAKLVRCSRGRIWDVAVDVRRGSASYGRWFGLELSAKNGAQLLIPRGFLHGFVTLEPESEVQYKVDNPYAPECDGAIAWDDPDIAIDWPVIEAPVLSGKDCTAPRMAGWANPFSTGDAA